MKFWKLLLCTSVCVGVMTFSFAANTEKQETTWWNTFVDQLMEDSVLEQAYDAIEEYLETGADVQDISEDVSLIEEEKSV
jgi:hypothetical protein